MKELSFLSKSAALLRRNESQSEDRLERVKESIRAFKRKLHFLNTHLVQVKEVIQNCRDSMEDGQNLICLGNFLKIVRDLCHFFFLHRSDL